MTIWRCKKCEKILPDYRRCDNCGDFPLKDELPSHLQKEAHEQSYYSMVRTHGKDYADKHWKP